MDARPAPDVSIVRCGSGAQDEVTDAAAACPARLGGIGTFIRQATRVLVTPSAPGGQWR